MNAVEKLDNYYDERLDISSPNYVYTKEDWANIQEGLDQIEKGEGLEEWDVYYKRLKAELRADEIQYNN
jgi:hypothetical protein